MAQLASAVATFSLRLKVVAREACTWWPWLAQPAQSTRCYALRNIECVSLTNHVFCTQPYRSDQSDALGHKKIISENIFQIIMYMYMYMYIPFIYLRIHFPGSWEIGIGRLLEVAVGLGLVVELLTVAMWLGSLGGLSFGGGRATSRTKEFLDCFGLFLLAPDFFLEGGSQAALAALFLDFFVFIVRVRVLISAFCVHSVHRVLIITTILPFFFSH